MPLAATSERWTVLYDQDCGLCKFLMALFLGWDRARCLRPLALQSEEADELLAGLTPTERMASWHLVSPAGERHSGGAALAPLLRTLPAGALAAVALERSPALAEHGYRWVAENRSGLGRWIPAGAKRRAGEHVHGRERGYGPVNPPA